jgi:hypothetical protein
MASIGDCEFGSTPAFHGSIILPEYRVYLVGDDGHFQSSIPLSNCPDDDAAIAAVKQLIDGHDVELWQLDRKIAVLDHRPNR